MANGSPVRLPPLASLADCFSALRHSLSASLWSLSLANNLGVFPSLFFNVEGQPAITIQQYEQLLLPSSLVWE